MAEMVVKQPENRLTPEEIAYRRLGNSPETRAWNRHFEILVNEYGAAVEDGVDEVRRILGDSVREKCGLRRVARRALVHRQGRCCTC